MSIDPDRDAAIAFYNEGCMLVKNNSFQQAKEKFDQAVAKDPNYAKAWFNRALTCHHLGQLPDVQSSLKKVVNLEPNNLGAWNRLAIVSSNLDDNKMALEAFKHVIEQNPTPGTWSNIGVIYANMDQFDNALNAFKHALDLDPNYALTYYNLASIHARTENIDEVIKNLKMADEKSGKTDFRQKILSDPDFASILDNPQLQDYIHN